MGKGKKENEAEDAERKGLERSPLSKAQWQELLLLPVSGHL